MQTSHKQRTIDSALAQLDGLFAKPLAFPDIDPDYKLNVVPMDDDFILYNVAKNCHRLDQIIDDVNAQSATKAMLARLDSDLEGSLFPELRQITNMTDATTKDMHNVCNYLNWAKASDLTLNLTLTETQMNQCSVSYQRKVYAKFGATKELTYQPMVEFLEALEELSRVVRGASELYEATIFLKYFNRTGEASTVLPKFAFYSAHAETIAPLLRAFNYDYLVTPDPASMVLVNYYECTSCAADAQDRFQVVVTYYPHYRISPESEVLMTLTASDFELFLTTSLESYEAFSHVNTTDVPEMCSKDYSPPDPRNYSDPEDYRSQLYSYYGFP